MRVALSTLGCRLNQFETDAMGRRLEACGFELARDATVADVHLINSCSITQDADADARQLIRRLRRDNPRLRVVVTGCYATAAPAQVAALDGVALVIDNSDKHRVAERLMTLVGSSPGSSNSAEAPPLEPALPISRQRAYLKIQDGCDYRCSFCIVPKVRGNSRSISPSLLLDQVEALVENGAPEIVLTGVHLGTYGRDLSPRSRLPDLIEAMLPKLGSARLRLGSLDPHEVDDELIALMRNNPDRLCRYLHLPAQSGDPAVLRLMQRAHTVEDLARTVPRLCNEIAGIAVGSDVIVGFPQETPEAFANTMSLLTKLPLAYLHVFRYSPRSGTRAATMSGHVRSDVKSERSRVLRALSRSKQRMFVEQHVGKTLWGVVIKAIRTPSDTAGGQLEALTDNYIRVRFSGPDDWVGRPLRLQLDSSCGGIAYGTPLTPL